MELVLVERSAEEPLQLGVVPVHAWRQKSLLRRPESVDPLPADGRDDLRRDVDAEELHAVVSREEENLPVIAPVVAPVTKPAGPLDELRLAGPSRGPVIEGLLHIRRKHLEP